MIFQCLIFTLLLINFTEGRTIFHQHGPEYRPQNKKIPLNRNDLCEDLEKENVYMKVSCENIFVNLPHVNILFCGDVGNINNPCQIFESGDNTKLTDLAMNASINTETSELKVIGGHDQMQGKIDRNMIIRISKFHMNRRTGYAEKVDGRILQDFSRIIGWLLKISNNQHHVRFGFEYEEDPWNSADMY